MPPRQTLRHAVAVAACCVVALALSVVALRSIVTRTVAGEVARTAEVSSSVLADTGDASLLALQRAVVRSSWGPASQLRVLRAEDGPIVDRTETRVAHRPGGAVLVALAPLPDRDGAPAAVELSVPYAAAAAPHARSAVAALVVIAGALAGAAVVAVRRSPQATADSTGPAATGPAGGLEGFARDVDAAIAAGADPHHAVLLLGLDRLRELTVGTSSHAADQLLTALTARVRSALPGPATVERTATDELAVLVGTDTPAEAERLAGHVLACLEEPVAVADRIVVMDGTVGVAYTPDHGRTAVDLLTHAGAALDRARESGASVRTFDPDLDRASLGLEGMTELRDAIGSGGLEIHYQPQLDLSSGMVTGVEALVRWHHPTRGLVAPDEFIGAAERSSLIGPLTDHVLSTALAQTRAWRDAGHPLSVAVNLSTRSLTDPGLPRRVLGHVRLAGLPPAALKLEITESSVMADPERAAAVLDELAQAGVVLAVDDFGTGHSSLAYLRRLPVTWLKIDKAFVAAMGRDAGAATIVRSTVGLARSLGLRVVAEGVEDVRDWRTLRRLGCDAAQGFHLSPPVPAAQVPGAISALQRRARHLSPGSTASATTAGRAAAGIAVG